MRSRFGIAVVLTATVLVAAACSTDPAEPVPATGATSQAVLDQVPETPATSEPPAAPRAEPPGAARGPEPVRIGVVMAVTGREAVHDGPVLDTLQYAVRQVNASGGVQGRPLEVVFMDSRSELNGGYQAALRLAERDVPVIFATCDPFFNRPIREVAAAAGVLVIVPCGPEPAVGGFDESPLAFAAGTSATAYGRAMAEHAAAAGILTVATTLERDDTEAVRICDSFVSRFAELGGSVGFSFDFDRFWIAAQPVVGPDATALALSPLTGYPTVVACAAVGGRGREFFELMRSAGVASTILAPAALDGAAWRYGISGSEPLLVVTDASTFGDDPSNQVNAYYAALITGELRRRADVDEPDVDTGRLAEVEDRVGWGVTGAEALWVFIRAVQRTGSLDPTVLAADIERFSDVDLWMDSATFGPAQHHPSGRALRVIRHDGGASRLVEVRIPTDP